MRLVMTLPTKRLSRNSSGKCSSAVETMPAMAGRAVVVRDHLGAEAEAVVRLAEARIVRAVEKLIQRPRMAIGREEIAVGIDSTCRTG